MEPNLTCPHAGINVPEILGASGSLEGACRGQKLGVEVRSVTYHVGDTSVLQWNGSACSSSSGLCQPLPIPFLPPKNDSWLLIPILVSDLPSMPLRFPPCCLGDLSFMFIGFLFEICCGTSMPLILPWQEQGSGSSRIEVPCRHRKSNAEGPTTHAHSQMQVKTQGSRKRRRARARASEHGGLSKQVPRTRSKT